ncbi:MAG: hypothetical protein COB50_03135 [Thiotrichales bacterium]|nr:MAG: hypothetical protein COB50_03135 [Thiotrichales bacterium]
MSFLNVNFGHPKKLWTLCFSEICERFAFYNTNGILILYMTKVLLFSSSASYTLFGTFTALLYITPLVSGYLADKLLGFKRSVFIGGILMAIGFAMLSIPGEKYLHFALAIVVMGNGFFQSNMLCLLGEIYKKDIKKKESGFFVFYTAINIGGLLRAVLAASIIGFVGWHGAFLVASFMVLASITFLYFKTAGDKEFGVPPKLQANGLQKLCYNLLTSVIVVVVVLATLFVLAHPQAVSYTLVVAGVCFVGYSLYKSFQCGVVERNNLLVCHVLVVIAIVYQALFIQIFMSVVLFTEHNIDRTFLGWIIHTVTFQALAPFFVIFLAPMLATLWTRLGKQNRNLPTITKCGIGVVLMGASYVILSFSTLHAGATGLISLWWLVGSVFILALGELFIGPSGMSTMTTLSPANMVGLMMGLWFFSKAIANNISGIISTWTAVAGGSNPLISNPSYFNVFGMIGGVSVAIGVVILLASRKLNKMVTIPKDAK